MVQEDELSGVEDSPFTHVFCAAVHENLDCAVDLVRNLRFFEPTSAIVVYDGTGGSFLPQATLLERLGAVLHPAPRPTTSGRLHEYVFDVLEYADDCYSFDALTFVDSDQMLTRRGYAKAVQAVFEQQPEAGVLAMPNPSIGQEWGLELEPNEGPSGNRSSNAFRPVIPSTSPAAGSSGPEPYSAERSRKLSASSAAMPLSSTFSSGPGPRRKRSASPRLQLCSGTGSS